VDVRWSHGPVPHILGSYLDDTYVSSYNVKKLVVDELNVDMGDRPSSQKVSQRCLRALVSGFGTRSPSKVKWYETTLNAFSTQIEGGLEKKYTRRQSRELSEKMDDM